MSPRAHRRLLALTLGAFLLLALGYGVVTPLFEAPDEHYHYFTAQFVADHGRLSVVADPPDPWLGPEPAQPPLYYIIAAALIAPVDTARARDAVWLNPFADIGDATTSTNVNNAVHGPWEAWPWRGYALAAHLLRALSTLFGLATLVLIYAGGRLLWPDHHDRALLATALTAALPQFAFVHAAVSNDPLIILLATAGVWQLLRLWRRPVTFARLLLLGVTIGLAALTKNAGLLLLLYAAGVLLLISRRDGAWRALPGRLAALAVPALLLAGWLWWRNEQLYGDWTATAPFIAVAGGDRGFGVGDVLAESSGLWLSLVAVFGWFNVRAPGWIYVFWSGLALAALLGQVGAALARRRGHVSWPALILAGWLAAVYGGLFLFMLRTPAAQGRLLLPAVAPLALGLAAGLAWWGERLPAARGRLATAVVAVAAATSLAALLLVIRPAYRPPPFTTNAPEALSPLDADLGEGVTLLAADLVTAVAAPGGPVTLDLVWRADRPPPRPADDQQAVSYVVELFGRDTALVGKLQSYHGAGLRPIHLWPPGAIVAERVTLLADDDLVAPVAATVQVKLAGDAPAVDVGRVKLLPAAWPPAPAEPLATGGHAITLGAARLAQTTARPGDNVAVSVTWLAAAAPDRDWTTLVHLVAAPGEAPLATGDGPPLAGAYPTRFWAAGEVVEDGYTLALPADLPGGRYVVLVGQYDPADLRRATWRTAAGETTDAMVVGAIDVAP